MGAAFGASIAVRDLALIPSGATVLDVRGRGRGRSSLYASIGAPAANLSPTSRSSLLGSIDERSPEKRP
jgi:hypothetical protein